MSGVTMVNSLGDESWLNQRRFAEGFRISMSPVPAAPVQLLKMPDEHISVPDPL
jgi:hypothetical protein